MLEFEDMCTSVFFDSVSLTESKTKKDPLYDNFDH